MRILGVSDLTLGGAAIVCSRLREAIRRRGAYEYDWLAGHGDPDTADVLASERQRITGVILRRLCRYVARTGSSSAFRLAARVRHEQNGRDMIRCIRAISPDIVHLHNVHDYVSFSLLERIPKTMPIAWTLHDMWPLTGYCLHSFDCGEYATGCRRGCKQDGSWGAMARSPGREWSRRQRFFSRNMHRVSFVCPSHWMARRVVKRFEDRAQVSQVAHGVDLSVFKPVPRRAAREVLGIDSDRRVVLTGASFLPEKHKGMAYFIEACSLLRDRIGPSFQVVVFGKTMPSDSVSQDWRLVGRLADPELLNLYYCAADVFVSPSIAESFGLVSLEAAAAGTPSVVFSGTACAERVKDGETGWVARSGDPGDLAACIGRVLAMSDGEQARIRKNCRHMVEAEYGQEQMVDAYLRLFDTVVQ